MSPVGAQPDPGNEPFCRAPDHRESLDVLGLRSVYCTTQPVLTQSLEGIHASARPVFYGAVPLAWGAAAVRGNGAFGPAYRLTVTQGTTYGLVLGLKRLVGRPRPFVRRALTSRSRHYGPSHGERYHSFPSGHAALSAAIVTSWSLSHPRWYVVAPGAAWAVGVSLSRLYLGVHYPSDVLAGTVLGVAVAATVHHVRHAITPARLTREEGVPIGLHVRF